MACSTPCTRSHPTPEFLSLTRGLLHDATMSMKIRFAVLGGPQNPGRWPVLRIIAKTPRAGRFRPPRRGPRRRSRLGLLTTLDAARRPCLHDLAYSTAVRLLGFVAQTKNPVFRRRLRPRSRSGRHSCRPVRAPVPAALHRRAPHGPSATAPSRQLSVDTRRLCTCNPKTKRTITPHG